jgi:hypothetical protein
LRRRIFAIGLVIYALGCRSNRAAECDGNPCAADGEVGERADLPERDAPGTVADLNLEQLSADSRADRHEVLTCDGRDAEIAGVSCIPPQPDGGIYGRCREESEEIEGKVPGAYCCAGLKKVSQAEPRGDDCVVLVPPSLLVCLPCGDGVCGTQENICNCPEDC